MGTGRVMLVTIPNRKRKTLEREIRKRVAAGALIWTDSFPRTSGSARQDPGTSGIA